MRLYIGLVHYPVFNKNHQRIASAITTVDLHDLSRLARTYGVKRFFVITPLKDQRDLAERIRRHWTAGYGAKYNHFRKQALEITGIVPSLGEAIREVEGIEGETPLLIATDASRQAGLALTYFWARKILDSERVVILLFGTAWGLDGEFMRQMDYVLEPIQGISDYNHLSVRTAAAIILDRLVGSYQRPPVLLEEKGIKRQVDEEEIWMS